MTSDAKRHVAIHLTPFAPGVGDAAMGDDRRWMVFWSVTPARAMAELCHRLAVEPAAIVIAVAPDAIEIRGPSAKTGGARAVLAMIGYGIEVGEIQAGLAFINDRRRPAA